MNTELIEAEEQVLALKHRIFLMERADDFYYSNGGYSEDSKELALWEKKVSELKGGA